MTGCGSKLYPFHVLGPLALLLATCSAAPPSPPRESATEVAHRAPAKRFIATIAVDDYADRPLLTGAVADADEVSVAFTGRLGFTTDDRLHLRQTDATARGIRRFIGPRGPLNELPEESLLVLYVALHAESVDAKGGPTGHIWARDVGAGSEPIPVGELLRALDDLKVAHVILLFDTCYGGLALEAADLKPLSYAELNAEVEEHGIEALRPFSRHSRKVLTAAGLAQVADDGDLTRRGRFAAAVLEGLDGAADLYPDGDLLFVELAAFVQDRVTRLSGGAQEPEYGGFRSDARGAPSLGPLALHAAGHSGSPADLMRAARAHLDNRDAWQARLTLGRYLAAARRSAIADRRDAEAAERLAANGDGEGAIARLDQIAERRAQVFGPTHLTVAVTKQRRAAIGRRAKLPADRVAELEEQAITATRRAVPAAASDAGTARALSALGGMATTVGDPQSAAAADEAVERVGGKTEVRTPMAKETPAGGPEPEDSAAPAVYRPAMIPITPGEYTRGSPADEAGRSGDERAHRVKLTRGFLMAETEVTQAQYAALMGTNPSAFKGTAADGARPVERVSWLDAVNYCNALSVAEGLQPAYVIEGLAVSWTREADGYRLPTEAEWEYAARAGTKTATYAGDLDMQGPRTAPVLDTIAWYGGNSASEHPQATGSAWYSDRASTQPVKSKQPNAWGLYGMLGNVWEWTWNRYTPDYPESPADGAALVDPVDVPRDIKRVIRGGAFDATPNHVRAASRGAHWRSWAETNIGFRPVRFTVSDAERAAGTSAVQPGGTSTPSFPDRVGCPDTLRIGTKNTPSGDIRYDNVSDPYPVHDHPGADLVAPRWSPDRQQLAFDVVGDGRTGIWRLRLAPELRAQHVSEIITGRTDGAALSDVAWAPDMEKVLSNPWVFTARGPKGDYDLFADGSWLTSNPRDDRQPDWSPDVQFIGYMSSRTSGTDIYALDLGGSPEKPMQVTAFADSLEFAPTWHPTQTGTLMFTRWRAQVAQRQIGLVLDITRPAESTCILIDWPGSNIRPTWSPDGSKVAFYSDWNSLSGRYALWVFDLISGVASRLATDVRVTAPGDMMAAHRSRPAWTADGRYIFYVKRQLADEPDQIMWVRADGREGGRLRTNTVDNDDLALVRKGDQHMLAFTATGVVGQPPGRRRIYLVTWTDSP